MVLNMNCVPSPACLIYAPPFLQIWTMSLPSSVELSSPAPFIFLFTVLSWKINLKFTQEPFSQVRGLYMMPIKPFLWQMSNGSEVFWLFLVGWLAVTKVWFQMLCHYTVTLESHTLKLEFAIPLLKCMNSWRDPIHDIGLNLEHLYILQVIRPYP